MHRLYFAAVGLLALWVGVWCYFNPARADVAIPWLLPPLCARFLGAMYFSGVTFMVGSIRARRWSEVQVVVPMIAIWTGMLLVVSLFHLEKFDYSRTPVWFWFGAYTLYPLIAIGLAWRYRKQSRGEEFSSTRLPDWARYYLLLQGGLLVILSLAMLLAPAAMVALWPWKIGPLMAQLYSAPFLSYGVGSLALARRRHWLDVRVAVRATLVFTVGVLLASLIHHDFFSLENLSTWFWFGGFAIAIVALSLMTKRAWQSERLANGRQQATFSTAHAR
jgi:hypothetical protein